MSAPRNANSRAVAAPMPLLPPVIRQTFPSSFILSSSVRRRSLLLGATIRASLSHGPSLALMLKYPLRRKRIKDVRASAMYHVFRLKEVVRGSS